MGRVNEEVEAENGTVLKYQHHANGRGFVSPKARVQPSTFVAATAYIEADARIGDSGTIGSGSWIDQG
jgi:UDP-3-O-[3-hydroxymyristoyl] glucosamine N-acyltransferase